MMRESLTHPFGPICDAFSRVLVLGSFPSAMSREAGFYYGHPRNRFWTLLAMVFKSRIPNTNEEKTALLLSNRVALWDVLDSCDIKGSSDASIRNPVVNDLSELLQSAAVERVVLNGKTAGALYQKYCAPVLRIPFYVLPSTSPANAAWSLERLAEKWREAISPALEHKVR